MWLLGPYALATRYAKRESHPSIAGDVPLIKRIDVRLRRSHLAGRPYGGAREPGSARRRSSSSCVCALIAGSVAQVEDGYREPAPAAGTTRPPIASSPFAVDHLLRPGNTRATRDLYRRART